MVVLQLGLEVLRLILVLWMPYSMQPLLLLILNPPLIDPSKASSIKSSLSNVQGPRYISASISLSLLILQPVSPYRTRQNDSLGTAWCQSKHGRCRACKNLAFCARRDYVGLGFRPQNSPLLPSLLCTHSYFASPIVKCQKLISF